MKNKVVFNNKKLNYIFIKSSKIITTILHLISIYENRMVDKGNVSKHIDFIFILTGTMSPCHVKILLSSTCISLKDFIPDFRISASSCNRNKNYWEVTMFTNNGII